MPASWPTCSGPGPDRVRGRPLVSFTVEWPPNSTTTPSSASNGAPPTPRSSGRSASSPSNGTPTSTRTRRRRALQGDQRGVPGAVRPGPPPALRHVRPGGVGGPARVTSGSVPGSVGSATSSTRSSAVRRPPRRGGRPQTGSDLRYDLRITFEEAITGTEKEIDFRVLDTCETCSGSGAGPGRPPRPARNATGAARYAPSARRCSARWSTCRRPRCRGEGRIVENRCDTCQGEGRIERAHPPSHHPGGHRRRPPDPPVRRRRGPAARRRAGQPVRGRPRQPASDVEAGRHRAVLRGPCRSSGPRSGRRSSCRPSRGTRRSR